MKVSCILNDLFVASKNHFHYEKYVEIIESKKAPIYIDFLGHVYCLKNKIK